MGLRHLLLDIIKQKIVLIIETIIERKKCYFHIVKRVDIMLIRSYFFYLHFHGFQTFQDTQKINLKRFFKNNLYNERRFSQES